MNINAAPAHDFKPAETVKNSRGRMMPSYAIARRNGNMESVRELLSTLAFHFSVSVFGFRKDDPLL
jgi:hypothetical protein